MNTIRRFLRKIIKPRLIEIILGLICTLFIVIVNFIHLPLITSLIQELNGRVYDQFIHLNWEVHTPEPKVVIVDIDEQSVHKEGRWPWPRDKMAALIAKLKQDGVVTIGLDIVMSEAELNYALGLKEKIKQLITSKPSENQKQFLLTLEKIAPSLNNDQIFAQTLLDHNIVLGYLFHNEPEVKKGALPEPLSYSSKEPIDVNKIPLHQFQGYNGTLKLFIDASTQAGFVTNLPDPDGTVRHSLVLASHDNKLYPSLALKTAMNYLLAQKIKLLNHKQELLGLDLNGTIIPINSSGQVLIPFWGAPGSLDYYSASDILHNKIDAKELEGSIAIIGSSMTLLADLHQSPVSQLFPGVEMVGNLVQGIISQQLITEFEWQNAEATFYLIVFGVILAFTFPFFGIIGKFISALIIILLALISTFLLFVYQNIYIPSAILLLLITLQAIISYSYAYATELKQRRKISQLFGQYVPKEYVQELIEFPERYNMEGQTRNMTVQFADIRNFTGITEVLDAAEVKRLLNTFFTPITEIIFSHRGTIDKYVGDMIVAFWGAPLDDKDHAYNAIMASLDIFKHLPEINNQMIANNLPTVNIGIGLSSGPMNVGDMGSEFRRAYTVLGDTVNLASRLQDLTKFYQVNILVNDTTRFAHDDFVWRAIDRVFVKGRKTALTIYQPLCLLTEASPELMAELEEYSHALEEYYKQNWLSAKKRFNELLKKEPNTYLYHLYLERIANFKKNPPPSEWNGVYTHTHK